MQIIIINMRSAQECNPSGLKGIEKFAVTFAGEVERGKYRFVSAEDLKGWID
jgi:hypothetical protein